MLNRYRDSYDELSKSIRTLAEEDEINDSLDEGLRQLSNAVTILGDFMDLQVNRMELKVLTLSYSYIYDLNDYKSFYLTILLPCASFIRLSMRSFNLRICAKAHVII